MPTTVAFSMFLSLVQQKTPNLKHLPLHMGEHMPKSEHCSNNDVIRATEEVFSGFSIVHKLKSGVTL